MSELTVKLAAAVEPNLTAVAPVKPVPLTVTDVAPVVGPWLGLIGVANGAGRRDRGDRDVGVDREARCRGRAELDRGGSGEAGAVDRDRRRTGGRALARADRGRERCRPARPR